MCSSGRKSVLEKVASKLSESGADIFVSFDPTECFYISGFNFSFAVCVVDRNAELFYFTDKRYIGRVKDLESKCFLWEDFGKFAEFLLKLHPGTIVVDGKRCSTYLYRKLLKCFNVLPVDGFLDSIRAVKTDYEVSLIKEAASLALRALRKVLHLLKPGITERWFRAELVRSIFAEGGDGEAFPTIVAFGENSSVPHWEVSDRELKNGECVLVDFGVRFKGYVCDITRTFFIGRVNSRLKDMYDTVVEAQSRGIAALSPDVFARDVDSAVREFITARGYGEFFVHSTGHGIGIEVHEKPLLSTKSTDVLEVGNVVTVEPGIYISGFGGVRVEDDCVVMNEGVEVISHIDW